MAVTASAGDMVLTRNGEFYRVAPSNDGLVVNHRFTDGTVTEYLIPQTAGIAATSVQVGVDELTGAIFVVWQSGDGTRRDHRDRLVGRSNGGSGRTP